MVQTDSLSHTHTLLIYIVGLIALTLKSCLSLLGSTSEDMSSDSEYEVDTELLDSLGNTAVIEGPPGSGKTAAVFALAAEMGFNVLEVNASSNRTGKQVSLSLLSFLYFIHS